MGATPSQHISSAGTEDVQWPLQDDMGVVIALPTPPPLRQHQQPPPHQQANGGPISTNGRDYLGRRVLGVTSGSPAAACGLVPWLDYIVGVNGRFFMEEDRDFPLTKGMEPNRRVKLHVFNVKCNAMRECVITPASRDNQIFLGVRISLLVVPDVDCADKVVRVLDVMRRSPAAEAGLEPQTDYLLGSAEYGALGMLDDLESSLIAKEGKVLEMYVYNSSRDDIRAVQIKPRVGWSEDGGLLGAELANGILHRIPQSCRRTTGKDKLTAGQQVAVQSEVVRTPEGLGQLVETLDDGSSIVKLDWGLGPNVSVVAQVAAKHVDPAGHSE